MRILLNTEDLSSIGGLEMSLLQLGRELAGRGHDLDLLCVRHGNLTDDYRRFCGSVVRVPSFSFSRKRGVRDLARIAPGVWQGSRCHPDVVYVNRFSEMVFGILTGWASGAPVVCHLRYFSKRARTHLLGSRVRRFVAVSYAQRAEWIREGLEPEWIEVVHNGIDPATYPVGGLEERRRARENLGLPPNGFVVLYCGRTHPVKGIEVLFDAWRRLGIGPDEGRLVLLGDSVVPTSIPSKALYRRQLHDLTPPGCHWLPMQKDVVTPMHAADVVVLPSRSEPFGRVAIEALATGRPIVGSRVGGIPEILTGPLERFLFPDGDASALADRLSSLVGWQANEPILASSCADHVRNHFSLQQTADGVERILAMAAGGC